MAHQYLIQHPDEKDIEAALNKYDEVDAARQKLKRDDSFKPDHGPSGLLGLRTILPETFGGIATVHQDPSLEEFHKKVTLAPGEDEKVAYQDFRDAEWAKAYDEAQQRGTPIHRKTQSPEERAAFEKTDPKNPFSNDMKDLTGVLQYAADGYVFPGASALARGAAKVGGDAVTTVKQAAAGKPIAGRTAGDDAAEYMGKAHEGIDPITGAVIETAASLAPGSLAGKAAGALLGKPESIAGGVLRGAATGAALSAGSGVLSDTSKLAEDILRQQGKLDPEGKRQTGVADSLAETLLRTPGRAMGGGLFGLLPGAAAGAHGALRMPSNPVTATQEQRAFQAALDTGMTTTPLNRRGLEPPPSLSALMGGKGPLEHPNTVAMDAAEPVVAKGVASHISETTGPLEAEKTAAFKAFDDAGIRANQRPMTQALIDTIRERSYKAGEGEGALPMHDNSQLVKQLHRTAWPKIMADHEARAAQQRGGIVVQLDDAISSGLIHPNEHVEASPGVAATATGRSGSDRQTMPPGAPDAEADQYAEKTPPGQDYKASLPRIREDIRGRPMPPEQPKAPLPEYDPEENRPTTPPPPPPGPAAPGKVKVGHIDPTGNSIVFHPRDLTAKETEDIIGATDRAAGISEAQGAGKMDPAYKILPKAMRQVRDQFPPVPGVTDKYPDVTIQDSAGNPIRLTGWSAMAHAHHEVLSDMQRKLKSAGLPSDSFDPTDVLEQKKMRPSLQRVGVGEDNTTQALKGLGRKGGNERAIDDVLASRLLNGGELSAKTANIPSANELRAAGQLAHTYKYRLDPIAEFLGRASPAAAGVGPKIADPVTNALLGLAARTRQEHQ